MSKVRLITNNLGKQMLEQIETASLYYYFEVENFTNRESGKMKWQGVFFMPQHVMLWHYIT
ncbi:hypothetical protein [Bacillus sp. T3]|uniref:hypothetical protein n=1 Tax=Bacillus sp. T3 TaxID=467262 RepID=UPI0029824F4F|nr:hypothetical protein [Bacillus sp. T3]